MFADQVSNPESLALESDVLPTDIRGRASITCMYRLTPRLLNYLKYQKYPVFEVKQMRFVVTTF